MITPLQLQEFGLNKKEAQVYLASLELGPASVQNIAKQAGVHRVSTYDILQSLMEMGLVQQTVSGKKRFLEVIDPDLIYQSLHEKQIDFLKLLPQLRAIQHKGIHKPKVYYYEGRENVWKAYLDRIRHDIPDKQNLVYGTAYKLMSIYPKEYLDFTKERIKRGIKARIIVENSEFGQMEKEKAKKELREIKFLPKGKKFSTNTIIYGNRVMTVSWESMILVIVEDKDNADNQRMVWEMLWNGLK